MTVINPYTDRVTAQGGLNVNATPDAFGANVGAAMQNVGAAGMELANTLYQNEVTDDVTKVHVEMAKKRAEWQQKIVDMSNQAQPGDDTLAPRIMNEMQKDFASLSENVKTRQGQQTYARMAADMTSMFGQEAIGIQSRLDGEFAKNQYKDLVGSLGTVAAQDHTQVQSLVNQALAAIDDPNGRFAKVPETTREAFRKSVKEEIEYDAAKGFVRRFPNAALGSIPTDVRSKVQANIANPPTPGLPPNLGASVVKPYNQSNIDTIAKTVAQPSEFDKTFQAAAQLYNIDWRELKMRAVAESGLNPRATSQQGAGGIMQFTPEMAAQLKVNSADPNASIFAAARLLSDYRTKANGDMSKVDMMYYGGESGTAWGANTKQYAANLAAVRAATGLGSAVDPASFAANPTDATGKAVDWKKPTTGIGFIDNLPADKFFAVLSEAEHYQRAYDSMSERNRMEKKYNDQVAQEATMDGFYQRIINPTQDNGGKLDEITVIQNPLLTSQQKQHIIDTMSARTRELTSRADRSNPETVRALTLRIHAPDGDPTKIFNDEPIYAALKDGQISTAEFKYLQNDVRALKDGSTNGFQKDVNNARNTVFRTLQQNVQLQAMEMAAPGTIADISYRFDRDMEKQIEAYRKENKDPRVLLDPNSRDYLLRPGRIQSFFPNSQATLSNSASQVVASAKLDRAPDEGLVVNQQYKVNGQMRTYLGGPKNLSTSWN